MIAREKYIDRTFPNIKSENIRKSRKNVQILLGERKIIIELKEKMIRCVAVEQG